MDENDDMEFQDLAGQPGGDGAVPGAIAAENADSRLPEDPGHGAAEPAPSGNVRSATDLAAVYDIPVNVSAVLGKSTMQVSSLLKLGRGAVLELDRKVGEAIDIYVNNRLVARGEVVVVEERLGVTMTEIIKTDSN
jgi:flagellar motor switch protein FliN/FliY